MDPRSLVQPLDGPWQQVLDTVLREIGRPSLTTSDIARLAPKVEELSRAYNEGTAEGRRTKLPIEARIAFSFPRDTPKGAGAVRELVASGVLTLKERGLRVLDLGAGLGAMTWGLVRALAAAGERGRVEALLVDEDDEILDKAEHIARVARTTLDTQPIELVITTRIASLTALIDRRDEAGSRAVIARGPYDVVLLGQVLSEVDPRSTPEQRVERHAEIVTRLLETFVAKDGALVIVEPALRERTRSLHAVRDRVLDQARTREGGAHATVFAPCLHESACPALAEPTSWCHEDLRVDLPPWVTPLARAAGLRWQGLTFSYLVLRKDGRSPLPRFSADDRGRIRFRVVSDLLRSKGKTESFVCREDGVRSRIRCLDRDAAGQKGVPFEAIERGDIVTLGVGSAIAAAALPVDERGRVHANAHVAVDVGASRK